MRPTFPKSDDYIGQFLLLGRFPRDLGIMVCPKVLPASRQLDLGWQILSQCSTFDLAQLEMTSKSLRAFIHGNLSLYNHARNTLQHGECPAMPSPPASMEQSGSYSEAAFASWIFGPAFCSVCALSVASARC